MRDITIAGRRIGKNDKPFIVAEMSAEDVKDVIHAVQKVIKFYAG